MDFLQQLRKATRTEPEIKTGTVVRQSGDGKYDVRLANGQMLYRLPSGYNMQSGAGVRCTAHGVVGAASKNVISVTVSRADGDRIAPQIQSNLISTTDMAEMRGNRYLDDPDQGGFYMTLARNLSVPHKSGAAEARFASVQCTELFGYDPRIFRVNSYSWTWTRTPKAGTKAQIEVVEWHVPSA